MVTLPSWIQKENAQKAEAARDTDTAAQRRAEAADFMRHRSQVFWDQLTLALQFNAQALEKLAGEELHGSVSKSVTGMEHNLHIRVERRSVKHGPDFVWLNLWYMPGSNFMRCYYLDKAKPNIELIVSGRPGLGRDILAIFGGSPLNADQLGERVIRHMAEHMRVNRQC